MHIIVTSYYSVTGYTYTHVSATESSKSTS